MGSGDNSGGNGGVDGGSPATSAAAAEAEAKRRPAPPALHSAIARSGAGRPRNRPAVDGPCGCGWGDALAPRTTVVGRLLRMGGGADADAAGQCGCATAVIARVSFTCDVTAATLAATAPVRPLDSGRPRTTSLMLEAVEPDGPWRLFIGDQRSATMFGPYKDATDTATLVLETLLLLRSLGMRVRIGGDFERAMGTFRSCGVALPSAGEITGDRAP